jgi:hypothetical protein
MKNKRQKVKDARRHYANKNQRTKKRTAALRASTGLRWRTGRIRGRDGGHEIDFLDKGHSLREVIKSRVHIA